MEWENLQIEEAKDSTTTIKYVNQKLLDGLTTQLNSLQIFTLSLILSLLISILLTHQLPPEGSF